MESIATFIGREGGALPKDLKEHEAASHEAEGCPHTNGTEEDSIGECFVLVLAAIYILRLCIEEWC